VHGGGVATLDRNGQHYQNGEGGIGGANATVTEETSLSGTEELSISI
jgi:hypothetical protein